MKRVAICLLMASLFVSGCTKSGTSVPTDQLSIALPINPQQLNGILGQNSVEFFLDGLIYSMLVTIDDKGNEVPDLASVVPTQDNGGVSKDGLTITYHLRKNVKWHDGVPFTSKDVKYTWQQVMSPANNVVSRHGYDQVASVDTPDDATVVFHMKRVFPPAINTLFAESDTPLFVLPAHILAKYPNLNQVPFNAAPIGTGPYKFVRWQRGDRVLLSANPGYFKGAPAIKTLSLRIILDANTTESQLRSHEAQLGLTITAPTYNALASVNDVTRLVANAPSYEAIFFNTARGPLADVRVRRAIALATNRDEMVRTNTFGTGTVAVADLSPFYKSYFDSSLKPLPFDPDQAKALLTQAGWTPGSDGIRTKDGQKLSLQFIYGQGSDIARNIAVQLQQMLKTVGVDVQVKTYDYATLYAAAENGGILNSGKFDMTLYAWIQGADPDNSSSWLCSAVPPAGNNVTRYCSKEMDAAQAEALSTFDPAKRRAAYGRVESLLLRDVPGVFLYYQGLRYAHIPQLQNFTPNGISEGWNAYQWKIAP